eukprot:SAG11_NODE_75_length_18024_cov_5.885356_2_plen_151_part_00
MYPPLVTTSYTRDPASRVSTRGTQDCAIHSSSLVFSQSSWINSCRVARLPPRCVYTFVLLCIYTCLLRFVRFRCGRGSTHCPYVVASCGVSCVLYVFSFDKRISFPIYYVRRSASTASYSMDQRLPLAITTKPPTYATMTSSRSAISSTT